ncbi:helix-turn-helix domain-containing protein [Aliiroseovarius subalbicans]|uniref:GlxA family transcriptional regulator n=1 Tax=Aliiroseovarius subalbicans TaxID=2925840 RepID=UPI001F5979D7|nr:helix-turn-helix domain-containing protein [Aliiroseovarius subalbicans]MCI2400206.1 helix-turn-helix domain-containing protein [Aliiroseovarius subalbicans]
MTQQKTIHPVRFDILVSDGFVLTELAGVVEPLRLMNRVTMSDGFAFRYLSRQGGRVASRALAEVATDPVPEKPLADYLVVVGNTDPAAPELSVQDIVRNYTHRGAKVVLLAEAASRHISETDPDSTHTTHWENSTILTEGNVTFDPKFALAVEDGAILTCAGMGATVDLTLSLLNRYAPTAQVMAVAGILLHDRIRDFDTRQPIGGPAASATGEHDLDAAIQLMQANTEEPIPIHELVALLGLSNRSLERKFKQHLNTTPHQFYRSLRLNKAHNLLLNTGLSIQEIGLACGFQGGFSGPFKAVFGTTPQQLRARKNRQV